MKAIRKKIEIPERKGIFDLGIGAYLLNPLKNDYTYDDVAKEYLGEQLPSQEEVFSGMKKPDPKKQIMNRWQRMELTRHMWHFMEKTH